MVGSQGVRTTLSSGSSLDRNLPESDGVFLPSDLASTYQSAYQVVLSPLLRKHDSSSRRPLATCTHTPLRGTRNHTSAFPWICSSLGIPKKEFCTTQSTMPPPPAFGGQIEQLRVGEAITEVVALPGSASDADATQEVVTFETGRLAKQCDGSVVVTVGALSMFATVVRGRPPAIPYEDGGVPLTVEYREPPSARGEFYGRNLRRREGGPPTEREVLVGRAVDRCLRPLFPKNVKEEIQVTITAVSDDGGRDTLPFAVMAASAAMHLSNIPWNGPVGASTVAVGKDDAIMAFPRLPSCYHGDDFQSYADELSPNRAANPEHNPAAMIVSYGGFANSALMIEASSLGRESGGVPDDVVVKALELAASTSGEMIDVQQRLAERIGRAKVRSLAPSLPSKLMVETAEAKVRSGLHMVYSDGSLSKAARNEGVRAVKRKFLQAVQNEEIYMATAMGKSTADVNIKEDMPSLKARLDDAAAAFEKVHRRTVRDMLLGNVDGSTSVPTRVDGRDAHELRALHVEAPVGFGEDRVVVGGGGAHGSSLFMRGETQVVGNATLVFQPRRNEAEAAAMMAASGDGLFTRRMRKRAVEHSMHRAHRDALIASAQAVSGVDSLSTAASTIQENAEELYAPLHGLPSTAGELVLQYNFPPYCTNEIGRVGTTGRREMGHGNLAERALASLMPVPYATDDHMSLPVPSSDSLGVDVVPVPSPLFPFAVRVSANVMSSNGSSSMAAVCAGSLALADAGVPMPSGHCAGISIGLVMEEGEDDDMADDAVLDFGDESSGSQRQPKQDNATAERRYQILVDIQGLEDGMGDMDYKVAGTASGITAIQLDVKPQMGVPVHILGEALRGFARPTLETILQKMNATCQPADDAHASQARRKAHAPMAGRVVIPRTAVPRLIGPNGSRARLIEAESGAKLRVRLDGNVDIVGSGERSYEHAKRLVTRVLNGGLDKDALYMGIVTHVAEYAAFVKILRLLGNEMHENETRDELPSDAFTSCGGVEGMVHITEVSDEKLASIDEVLRVNQLVRTRSLGCDDMGNVLLSLKGLEPLHAPAASSSDERQIGYE